MQIGKVYGVLENIKSIHKMPKRILLSGGGTGGHIFPAIAIAQEFRCKDPKNSLLFVGAIKKMEMEKVPLAGFKIRGLWIDGLHRRSILRNILLPLRLVVSFLQSFITLLNFKPHVVIGTGGYASFPTLMVAQLIRIPTFIHEQNSFPGIANRLLTKRARKVFVAYDGMEKYISKNKLIHTGIPVRRDLEKILIRQLEAKLKLDLIPEKKVLVILGGSLGSKAINQLIESKLQLIHSLSYQVFWQCGNLYYQHYKSLQDAFTKVMAFVIDMKLVYAAADLIICRSGATTIAELTHVGKPSILIPSPLVAENHQYYNARLLEQHQAAILIEERKIEEEFEETFKLVAQDVGRQQRLSKNLQALSKTKVATSIVNHIENEMRW